MEKMLWCKDGLTWELRKYPSADWPSWTVKSNDGGFFTSENLYDCILWAELETGKKIRMTDVFSWWWV